MNLSDNHIKKLNAGNINAFREIYDELYYSLCVYAYQKVSDRDVVQDIVQEAFIILWDKREKFSSILGTKSYLYTIVRNKSLNFLKKDSSQILELEKISNIEFDTCITKEETYKLLHNAIEQLPTQTQKIISLAINENTNMEIAEELEISINTVKTLKRHGYAKLRDMLKHNIFLLLLLAKIFES
ncbi:MAG: sigma-70 family RNA polymerase sigma factor [Bacteroidales bacterium]|nr:sigma-70 family RNA polymerase sigma factor [Bacteroidales bacterium]